MHTYVKESGKRSDEHAGPGNTSILTCTMLCAMSEMEALLCSCWGSLASWRLIVHPSAGMFRLPISPSSWCLTFFSISLGVPQLAP